MDAELKALLEKLLVKLDGFDKRLADVEKKAHDQITLDDYWKKFGQIPWPAPSEDRRRRRWEDLVWRAPTNPLEYIAIC